MTADVYTKGRTLWQVLVDLVRGDSPASEPPPKRKPLVIDLYNPLKLSVGGYVRIETPEFFGYTFSVEKIAEFTRRIGKSTIRSVDYVLWDPDKGEEGVEVTVRVLPGNAEGEFKCYLLRQTGEFAHDDDYDHALKKDEIEAEGVLYQKVGMNNAELREVTADGTSSLRLRYWDFINEEGPEPRLFVVELDLSDREGVISTFTGHPLPYGDVKPVSGHTS